MAFFGAPKPKLGALSYPHDFINYIPYNKDNIFTICFPFYESGCNLKEIARLTGFARTSIRTALITNGVELREFDRSSLKVTSSKKHSESGGSPYGYCWHQGKLIQDKCEYRIVLAIYALWKKSLNVKSIADHLHSKKIFSRMNKQWTMESIKRIIQRHEARAGDKTHISS